MVLSIIKWPFSALFDPISSQSPRKVLSSVNRCHFFRFQDVFLVFWVRECAQFKIFDAKNSLVYGFPRFSAQFRCFRSYFDFWFLLSSWPCDHCFWWWEKFGLKAHLKRKGLMIFLCFWGKSSLVSWLLRRLTWSDHCCSGIILCCIDWLSKLFRVT